MELNMKGRGEKGNMGGKERSGLQPLPGAHENGPNCTASEAPAGLEAPWSKPQDISSKHLSKPLGHLIQALLEFRGLLQGVCRRRCQRRAISGMPLLVLLHSLGSVCFTRAIGGHIEGLDLVDVVVIHAPLGEDVLAPRAVLPVAAIVRAGREHAVAILQILREHLDCSVADDLQMAEEAVLDVGTILVVEAVRPFSCLGAQPSPQTLRDENSIGVDLDSVVCRPPLTHLTDLHPDLVEHPPIHPSARILSLQLVELAERVFHLSGHITSLECRCHVAEHIPLLASEEASTPSSHYVQQLELMVHQLLVACILRVHRETIEVLPERRGDRHRVRLDDVASESLHASCAGLVALSLALSFCEAFVPRDLAATSADAILIV